MGIYGALSNDNGRVVVPYNDGQQLEVAQAVTANFNAVSSSLEASNTDLSEEFIRLIVTQQAYAAGTRIVSTADEMLREALNMLR